MLVNLFVCVGCVVVDVGDVICQGDVLEDVQSELVGVFYDLFDCGVFLIVFGGGYEIVWVLFGGLVWYLVVKFD